MKGLISVLAFLMMIGGIAGAAPRSEWAYHPDAFPLPAPPTTTVSTGMKCTPNPAPQTAIAPNYTVPIGTIITTCVVSPVSNPTWNGNVPPLADTRLKKVWTGYNVFNVVNTKAIVLGNYSVSIGPSTP